MRDSDLWLGSLLRPEAPRLLLGAGALVTASFVNFRTGAQLRRAIEAGPGESQAAIARSLALFGAGAVAGCVRTCVFEGAAERLRASLAAEVFAAHLSAEPGARKGQGADGSAPVAAAAVEADVVACAELVPKLQNVVRYLSSVVGGTAAMLSASWKLTAAVWPLLAASAVHGARAGARRAGAAAQRIATAREEAAAFAEERLQHAGLVRWFSRAAVEAAAFRGRSEACADLAARGARSRGLAHAALDFTAKGILLGLCHLGSRLVLRGDLTAGELTSFFFHASFLGLGLYGLVGVAPEIAVAREAAWRLAGSLPPDDGSADEPHCSSPPSAAEVASAALSFQDVSFSYPSGERVLDAFSLEVPAGTTCALVGPSGCGKSTAISLLLRDYDSFAGQILVGGREVRSLPRHELRTGLAVAPQQSALLGDSVRQAIAFGLPSAGAGAAGACAEAAASAAVAEAARRACAHDFVAARPEGYDAPVGRGGQLLSGGERQRVAVARALVRGAPVLVLDEPTSALDAATAAALADAVLAPRPGRPTTLVVSHSLGLIRRCDAVAVMSSAGRVTQRGTLSELVADPGGALAEIMKAGALEDDVA